MSHPPQIYRASDEETLSISGEGRQEGLVQVM